MSPKTDTPRPVQEWPSPWPYDFPVEGAAKDAGDKVARLDVGEREALPVTRRGLFSAAFVGWNAFAAAGGLGTLGLVRFLFPNVNFDPPQQFQTKEKSAFSAETVDETWKESDAVWMVSTAGKLMAISTICTHLGCTPNWLVGDKKFKCPCHGSGYYINGVNFEGPTPRPLERYRVYEDTLTGKVVVDKTAKCRVELGTCDNPQFYIPVA